MTTMLTLKREPEFYRTWGQLYVDGIKQCETLEDKVRPISEAKVLGDTAIPLGKYEVIVSFSNKFRQYMPLLLNVPGFTGIRIHSGNTTGDTIGCILVGQSRTDSWLGNSRLAYRRLFPLIRNASKIGKVYIEIVNAA